MMKSKPSLKNSIKPALLFSLFVSIFLYGCENNIKPTYKEADIPCLVQKMCKNEYSLDVTTQRTTTTLWIYAPLQKILHKDFSTNPEKIFDEEISDKLRNILTAIGRVLISSDNTPEFFALVASDIKIGFDYIMIGNVLDVKKTYAGFIPWTESNKRYVLKFNVNPDTIGDITGKHLKVYDITLPDFLASQIAQRINVYFQDETHKEYFKIEKIEGKFDKSNLMVEKSGNNTGEGSFIFNYSITQISKPPKEINITKEVLKIIAYCFKTYEFNGFSNVMINDLSDPKNNFALNKKAILAVSVD